MKEGLYMHSVPRRTPAPVAWLLPVGTLFFMCGIFLGRSLPSWIPALLALLLGLGATLLSQPHRRAAAVLMVILSIGALMGWQAYHPPMPAEGEYTVRGTVAQEVAWEANGQVQTQLTDVTLGGVPQGDAYWTFYLDEDETPPGWLIPGAQVEMIARAYPPEGQQNPGGFNFKEHLLQRNVTYGLYGRDGLAQGANRFSLRGWIAAIRHGLALRLMDVMGPEAGAYAAAMLLGTRTFIPEDDRAAFHDLGIAHILSVSGFHVGVLVGVMLILFRPLPVSRAFRVLLEAGVLGAYCLLTGGSAPVIRAALLLLWREFTMLRHRQIIPLHMLCVTALVQLIFNPTLLCSASFQLTYSAMLGLLIVCPWLKKRRACRTRLGQKLWEAFCASLAAQLGILFPQLYWFGELPLFSIVLNMAVIPLFSGLIFSYWLTLATLPFAGLSPLLGAVSARATTLILAIVRWLSSLNLSTLWTRQADVFTFAGWVLLLVAASGLLPRRMAQHRRRLLYFGMALVALLLIPLLENSTTYLQLSVGDADAAVLQDQDLTVIIDTGEDGQALANYLHQRRQSVEMLIITHMHTDHGGGIRALIDEGIPVSVCYLPWNADIPIIDEEMRPLIAELAAAGTELRSLHRDDTIALPSGQLTVLWPEAGRVFAHQSANDVCLVLHADIAGVTMLLPSDLPGTHEPYVSLPADILKAAHHGSNDSTTADFLNAVAPQVLLLSNRLESREMHMAGVAGDIPLYSTEQHGGIIIRFHGDGAFTVDTVKK